MTISYIQKTANGLSEGEIRTILSYWEVEEWKALTGDEFRDMFKQSEFHLLTTNHSVILCLARINFDFAIRTGNALYTVAELVGLVATEPGKGYGKELLSLIQENVKSRDIELISFCEKANRGFYQKCGVPILTDQARQLREPDNGDWLIPTDDDILAINLSEHGINLLNSLNPEKPGYLVWS